MISNCTDMSGSLDVGGRIHRSRTRTALHDAQRKTAAALAGRGGSSDQGFLEAYFTAHSWLCTRPSSKSWCSDGSDPCVPPCSSWNCSVSVLPASAVVLDLPPEIAVATA